MLLNQNRESLPLTKARVVILTPYFAVAKKVITVNMLHGASWSAWTFR